MTIFITNPDGVITTDKPTSGGGGATTLEELTDVNITAPLNDGEVILYDALETKWVNDGLAEVAYTGAFGDLSDTPTTLGGYGITDATPATHVGSGGTQHADATTSVAGFMSASDKTKLDGIGSGANVTSVAGKTGVVTLTSSDVGLGSVENTALSTWAGSANISTVGTITSGTWTGGTIAIANGGTGQTSANAALNALLPSQTSNSGKYLTTDGTNASWATVSGGVSWAAFGGTVTTAPVATGEDSIAIGDGASASSNTKSIVIGYGAACASSSGNSNILIGDSASIAAGAGVGEHIVIGKSATAPSGRQHLAIGYGAKADSNFSSIAIGQYAFTQKTGAIFIGTGNSGGSYKSSGNNSIVIGTTSNGSGDNSIGIGTAVNFTGSKCVAIGYAATTNSGDGNVAIGSGSYCNTANSGIAIGKDCGANGAYSIAIGRGAVSAVQNSAVLSAGQYGPTALTPGSFGFSSGGWSSSKLVTTEIIPMWVQTTDATVTKLGCGANSSTAPTNYLVMENDSTYIVEATIVARDTGTDGNNAGWKLSCVAKRDANAASMALVGSQSKAIIGADAGMATADVNMVADTTNGRINIEVTGIAATTIKWVATVWLTRINE